ncbi:hypothetical protein Halru_2222 [Halovivax ruber XH-70]|uniref:Uncharacterized protein n=1 Tax=Halovivax ruber (strain DSM 18193 / JCM 13892 / XH-70) TaxID=797302 RepID=L0IDI9_HALRX|nr:hypothetical protein [Halovivax ruber]AGB16809.1 hypothetical protein Halru_2222 [Halovivax ruber XH-70]
MSDSVLSSVTVPSPITVFLVFTLVLLTLGAGTGVATADSGDTVGKQCPSDNPTRAYEHVPGTAVMSSEYGRSMALFASGCDVESVEQFGEVG